MNLTRITADDLADEMGGDAPNAMYRAGFRAPYHIADIVGAFGTPAWSRYWPEAARRAFVGALVGTPEVTAETAKQRFTRAVPAVTADMRPWDAWACWLAYHDTICDEGTYAAHTARLSASIHAAVAALRTGI